MITVENLSFTYRKSKRAVLRDFSLSFQLNHLLNQRYQHPEGH